MPEIVEYAVCVGDYVKVGRRKRAAITWRVHSTGHALKDAEDHCLRLRTTKATTLVRPFPACVAGPAGNTFTTPGDG